MNRYPDRPYGWGICGCGADCEESDYDEDARVSICPACRARLAQSEDERQTDEIFTRR